MKKHKLYKEIDAKTKCLINPIDQENSRIMVKMSTELIEASENEVICCAKYFNDNHKCKYHLVYEEPFFVYSVMYCGICGKFIATI